MKAMIVGLSGTVLTDEEKTFIKEFDPWGFILFSRNIAAAEDVRALTQQLRQTAQRDVLIFIDQEGGRVQRLQGDLAPIYPSAAKLGELHRRDREKGERAAWLMSRLHAFDLKKLGINADCLPVLDVPILGAHDVIGSRAYSNDASTVTALGRAAAKGLRDGGVLPVMKHIPGHGRAFNDTHFELARVTASLADLERQDFVPFNKLSDLPIAMTAHVIYSAIDAQRPATLSKIVVNDIIRKKIGFDGLLMTDDISMKALQGEVDDLTHQVFEAGCDIVLHCNGNLEEMSKIAYKTPILENKALQRARLAQHYSDRVDHSAEYEIRNEFAQLVSLV